MTIIDIAAFEKLAVERESVFRRASPYPYTIIDDFLPRDVAIKVVEEFEASRAGWNRYRHYNEDKYALTKTSAMGPVTQKLFEDFQSSRFVAAVGKLSGIEGLISDPDLDGAGLHEIKRGGFLNVHTDFLSHTKRHHWSRQINLLYYLNPDWKEEWNGALELWDNDMKGMVKSIPCVLNRCVIFHTKKPSYHGHPIKLDCPEGVTRKSIALYYFRDEGIKQNLTPTHYRARPEDSATDAALIVADRQLVRGYSFLKRYTGLTDGLFTKIGRAVGLTK